MEAQSLANNPKAKRKLNIDEESLTLDHQLNVLKRLYETLVTEKTEETESQLKKRDVNEFKELTFNVRKDKLYSQTNSIVFFSGQQPLAIDKQMFESREWVHAIIENFSLSESVEQLIKIAMHILGNNFNEFESLMRTIIEAPIDVAKKIEAIGHLLSTLFNASHSRFEQVNELIIDLLDANYKNLVSTDFYKAWDDFVLVSLLGCSDNNLQARPTVIQNREGVGLNFSFHNFLGRSI